MGCIPQNFWKLVRTLSVAPSWIYKRVVLLLNILILSLRHPHPSTIRPRNLSPQENILKETGFADGFKDPLLPGTAESGSTSASSAIEGLGVFGSGLGSSSLVGGRRVEL